MEKLGENRKKCLFSKASLYSVTKIPGLTLVPDPSFIRIRYFFQTLRLFATLRLLERLEYVLEIFRAYVSEKNANDADAFKMSEVNLKL